MSLPNPKKRSHSEASTSNIHIRSVRRELSPSALEPSDSSVPNSCSVSEDSALFSTEHSGNETANSDFDSMSSSAVSESSEDTSSGSDSENESMNVEDGSEDESMSEAEVEIVTLPLPKKAKKPTIKAVETVGQEVDLGARLKRFLPQLAAANQELEICRAAGTLKERNLEVVDEEAGKEYIEMVRHSKIHSRRFTRTWDTALTCENNRISVWVYWRRQVQVHEIAVAGAIMTIAPTLLHQKLKRKTSWAN